MKLEYEIIKNPTRKFKPLLLIFSLQEYFDKWNAVDIFLNVDELNHLDSL
jgi:hypothetical protein